MGENRSTSTTYKKRLDSFKMPFTIKTFTSSNPAERARRNSTKMSSPQQPTMLAYRDENNTTIKYAPSAAETDTGKKSGGLLSKLKGSREKEQKDKIMKVVYMPRREYQKWFARDEKGNYVGSEEHRRWTEEELEEAFKQYKPEPTKEKKTGLLSGTDGIKTGGALSSLSQGLA